MANDTFFLNISFDINDESSTDDEDPGESLTGQAARSICRYRSHTRVKLLIYIYIYTHIGYIILFIGFGVVFLLIHLSFQDNLEVSNRILFVILAWSIHQTDSLIMP